MTTNVLAILAHPNTVDSFNVALLKTTQKACEAAGAQLTINDLYKKNFQPVLTSEDLIAIFSGEAAEDVQEEQQLIAEADVMVIHHPVFWFDRPAILKGWFDRVFTNGFAFKLDENGVEGLLKSKKARVIQTAGTSAEFYQSLQADQYPQAGIERGTLAFCGIETQTLTHYNIFQVTDEDRKAMIAKTKAFVQQVLA